jgi:hypothetical protein
MPVGGTSAADLVFEAPPDKVVPPARRRKGRGKGSPTRTVVLSVMGLVGIGLTVWFVTWLRYALKSDRDGGAGGVFPIGPAAEFRSPGRPWRRSEAIERAVSVNLVLSRSEPRIDLAVYYRDFKTRMPGDAELVAEALGRLHRYFSGGLEWEVKSAAEPVRLGGRPAVRMEFEGAGPDSVLVNGECCMVAYRGYGYWFFTWGPLEQKEQISPEWEALRQGFALLGGAREGWKERPRETEEVRGVKAPYRLSAVKGLWTPENAEDYGDADVVLKGAEPDRESRYADKVARLRVIVLPRAANLKAAADAARKYLDDWQAKEWGGTLEPVKEKGAAMDRDTDVGPQRGHLSKFQVVLDGEPKHFVLLAAVNSPRGNLVLLGDCLWERHDFWDQEFVPLLASLRAR